MDFRPGDGIDLGDGIVVAVAGEDVAVRGVHRDAGQRSYPDLLEHRPRIGIDDVADQLREKFPKLALMMDGSEGDVLAFMDFPKAHRKQIASTNPIERVNAEIKRRTDVVGIFPNDGAIVRLIGAILLERNDEWQLVRRYMQLEGMNTVSDN